MAKYIKGQSGNPKGRPKAPPEIQGVKELTRHNLTSIMNKYMYKSRQELQELFKSGSLVMIEEMVVRLMLDVSAKGNERTFDMLIDRIIGKTPLVVESHNFDENKTKALERAEKMLLKILLDEKSEDMTKVYVSDGLLKK